MSVQTQNNDFIAPKSPADIDLSATRKGCCPISGNPVFIRVLHHDVSDDAVFHHSRFNIITHLRHSSKTDPHQSSSSSAGSPSASSTHDGSYLAFFIEVPHDGHILYGLLPTALHPEQIYSSARNRCVRCVQCADFIVLPHIAKASGTG